MDIIFASKVLAGIIGFCVGLALSSLISAVWLRLAAQLMRFGVIPFITAFKCALISNFVVVTFNFMVGFNQGTSLALLGWLTEKKIRTSDLGYVYSPTFFLCSIMFSILLTAAIFCRTLPSNDNDSRITFTDSLALTAFYSSLSFACMLLLVALVSTFLLGLIALTEI